jgi:hypothetical protein
MLAGALIGAMFVIHDDLVYPVLIALIVILIVAATSRALARSDAAWARPLVAQVSQLREPDSDRRQ